MARLVSCWIWLPHNQDVMHKSMFYLEDVVNSSVLYFHRYSDSSMDYLQELVSRSIFLFT